MQIPTCLKWGVAIAACVVLGHSIGRAITISNPTGGVPGASFVVADDQYLGTRFTFTSAFRVQDVAVEFGVNDPAGRNFFAAVIALPTPDSLPTGSSTVGFGDLSEVIYTTLFDPGIVEFGTPKTVTIPFSLDLTPGTYGFVFGAGLFGSPGGSAGAFGGLQSYTLAPGSETITWVAPSDHWWAGGMDDYYTGPFKLTTLHVSVTGESIPDSASTLWLVIIAIPLVAVGTVFRRD